MNAQKAIAFVEQVAKLLTFQEAIIAEDPEEDPHAAQMDLDTLVGDHDTLEALIEQARQIRNEA